MAVKMVWEQERDIYHRCIRDRGSGSGGCGKGWDGAVCEVIKMVLPRVRERTVSVLARAYFSMEESFLRRVLMVDVDSNDCAWDWDEWLDRVLGGLDKGVGGGAVSGNTSRVKDGVVQLRAISASKKK